jgi:hypothetical protein
MVGIAMGAWGTTLAGIVTTHPHADVAAPEPRFGTPQSFMAAFDDPTITPPTCIYRQTNQGMLIVISAKTGSLLSEAQSAKCSK